MTPLYPGVIQFGIERRRILELRIAGLAAERVVTGNGLAVQSTGQIGRSRQPGKGKQGRGRRSADVRRRLAAQHMVKAEPCLQERRIGYAPRVPDGGLLLNGVDKAVSTAA